MGMVKTTIPALRKLKWPSVETDYFVTDTGKQGIMKYNPSDKTTPDDNLYNIVGKNGSRYKRKSLDMSLLTVVSPIGGATGNTTITPPAPTGGTVNDTLNTFTFTLATGYGANQHEYRINGGAYITCTSNVIDVGNIGVAIGNLSVRVKAGTGRNAGPALFNTAAFSTSIVFTPPAPTGGTVDNFNFDGAAIGQGGTFTFIPSTGFVAIDHEYSINGSPFVNCTSNVIDTGHVNIPVGGLLVRVRAGTGRNAGPTLSNATAFSVILGSDYLSASGGTTLQTTALQNALNAAAGKRLVLPGYTFYTAQINPPSNIRIVGSPNTLVKTSSAATVGSRLFQFTTKNFITLENVKFDLSNVVSGDEENGTTPIAFESNCQNFKLVGCTVNYNTFAGVKIVGSSYGQILNNSFLDTDTAIHCFDEPSYTCTNLLVKGNTINGGTSEGMTFTVTTRNEQMSNIVIEDNIVLNKMDSFGIGVNGVDGFTVKRNTITNCVYGIGLSNRNDPGAFASGFGPTHYDLHSKNGVVGGSFADRNILNNIIIDAIKGQANDTVVSYNDINNSGASAINTQRGNGASSYLGSNMDILYNDIDGIGVSGAGGGAGIKFVNLNSSQVSYNDINTMVYTGSYAGIQINGTYGGGNVFSYNVCNHSFEWIGAPGTQNMTGITTVANNTLGSWSNYAPNNSLGNNWTFSNNTPVGP